MMESKDRDIWKEKLNSGFSDLTPDCFDDIRKALPDLDETERPEPEKRTVRSLLVRLMPAAAFAAAVIFVFSFVLDSAEAVEKMLYIDVNPSICISIKRNGRIASVDGVNEDGRKVVGAVSEELSGITDPDRAVICVVSEMDREGYFGSGTVEALVSLCYSGKEDDSVLDLTCGAIEEYAEARDLDIDLVSQSFERDKDIEAAAAGFGISAGKYEYIVDLTDDDGSIDIGELAEKSAGEIEEYAASSSEEKTGKGKEKQASDKSGKPDEDPDEKDKGNGRKAGSASGEKDAAGNSVKSGSSGSSVKAGGGKNGKKVTAKRTRRQKKRSDAKAGGKGNKGKGKKKDSKNGSSSGHSKG